MLDVPFPQVKDELVHLEFIPIHRCIESNVVSADGGTEARSQRISDLDHQRGPRLS